MKTHIPIIDWWMNKNVVRDTKVDGKSNCAHVTAILS